jgi:hypothetical protein
MGISAWFPYESTSPRDSNLVITPAIVGSYLIKEGFHRCAEFFVTVAGLAGRHHIASHAFPSPSQWHHMIHGQVIDTHVLLAEVADSFLDLGYPPLGLPQFFSALTLNTNMPLNGVIVS